MQKVSMLGSGFIGRFYTDSLHGYRNKDKVVSVYSRRLESAKNSMNKDSKKDLKKIACY